MICKEGDKSSLRTIGTSKIQTLFKCVNLIWYALANFRIKHTGLLRTPFRNTKKKVNEKTKFWQSNSLSKVYDQQNPTEKWRAYLPKPDPDIWGRLIKSEDVGRKRSLQSAKMSSNRPQSLRTGRAPLYPDSSFNLHVIFFRSQRPGALPTGMSWPYEWDRTLLAVLFYYYFIECKTAWLVLHYCCAKSLVAGMSSPYAMSCLPNCDQRKTLNLSLPTNVRRNKPK